MRTIGKLADVLERTIFWFAAVSAGAVGLMAITVLADVSGRFFFNRPIMGATEVSALLVVFLFYGGIAYCAQRDGHIAVDMMTSRLNATAQSIIDVIVAMVVFSFCAFTSYIAWESAYEATAIRDIFSGTAIDIPTWPGRIMIALGFSLLSLQYLIYLFRRTRIGTQGS